MRNGMDEGLILFEGEGKYKNFEDRTSGVWDIYVEETSGIDSYAKASSFEKLKLTKKVVNGIVKHYSRSGNTVKILTTNTGNSNIYDNYVNDSSEEETIYQYEIDESDVYRYIKRVTKSIERDKDQKYKNNNKLVIVIDDISQIDKAVIDMVKEDIEYIAEKGAGCGIQLILVTSNKLRRGIKGSTCVDVTDSIDYYTRG